MSVGKPKLHGIGDLYLEIPPDGAGKFYLGAVDNVGVPVLLATPTSNMTDYDSRRKLSFKEFHVLDHPEMEKVLKNEDDGLMMIGSVKRGGKTAETITGEKIGIELPRGFSEFYQEL